MMPGFISLACTCGNAWTTFLCNSISDHRLCVSRPNLIQNPLHPRFQFARDRWNRGSKLGALFEAFAQVDRFAEFDNDAAVSLGLDLGSAEDVFLEFHEGFGEPFHGWLFADIVAGITEDLHRDEYVVQFSTDLGDLLLGGLGLGEAIETVSADRLHSLGNARQLSGTAVALADRVFPFQSSEDVLAEAFEPVRQFAGLGLAKVFEFL